VKINKDTLTECLEILNIYKEHRKIMKLSFEDQPGIFWFKLRDIDPDSFRK
jgi:hypothetical protein